MDVNFWGTVYCTKFALHEIIKKKALLSAYRRWQVSGVCPAEQVIVPANLLLNGFLEALRTELWTKE